MVADVHAEVVHSTELIVVDEVCSPAPKLSPVTVTDVPSLCATFSKAAETTDASKLHVLASVPPIADTVTI